MKNDLLKKALPHIIAIVIFLAVSILFCKPVLDGNVLNQSDIIGWKGMSQNAFDYKEKAGHFPLWNTNLFSGMPNYQIAMEVKSILPDFVKILALGLPKPMNFFFLACISFYILCLAFRTKPVVGILGALAFAFSTYNPIIIGVGHESKMLAIAFMPLLLSGLILTYQKKYWLGIAVAVLGAELEIGVNHPQINYYFILIAIAITTPYAIAWIKNKEWKHAALSFVIVSSAALIGLGTSAATLWTSYEYAKATMRGGKDIAISGESVIAAKTSGLDTSYAFQYSFGQAETVTLLMPKAFGESSSARLDENSNVIKKLVERSVPENSAMQVASQLPKYWGGIESTSGPVYYGVIICLLALIGFVIIKEPVRWGLLGVSILGILMSWGKYLPGFNNFLFEHLPMYNKFRAPSMSLVITELTIPIVAVLSLQQLIYGKNGSMISKEDFKKILYAIGSLFVVLIGMYFMLPYSSPNDTEIRSSMLQASRNNEDIARAVISGLKEDRSAMFGGQLLRALGFAVVLIGLIYLYMRNIIKPLVVAISLIAITAIDLISIDKDYLSAEHYTTNDDLSSQNYNPSPIEQQVLKDKEIDFRVFNTQTNLVYDRRSPYYFKSIGGYHPARLRIYQDIIDKYLYRYQSILDQFSSAAIQQNMFGVLDMLNAKYIIAPNAQTKQPELAVNPHTFGPCWFVKNVKIVPGLVDEFQALDSTNLRDTAIVNKDFSSLVTQPQWDSTATLSLSKFDNDTVTYSSNSTTPQFAVFSEVYYPFGWNAYLDDKRVDYVKANYILRGLSVPAGKHTIKFIFEPTSYKSGSTISYIASYLVIILLLGGLFMGWKTTRNSPSNQK